MSQNPAEPPVPPAVDISSEAITEHVRLMREARPTIAYKYEADLIEALAADRDRLRTFVRSARGIIQAYASANPKHVWGCHEIDPLGAHAWLAAESAEIGTMRDGGDPKVEART